MKTRKTLKIGSEVLYQYFNKPEGKFYGDIRKGIVKDIFLHNGEKLFVIERQINIGNSNNIINLTTNIRRKEIKSILS